MQEKMANIEPTLKCIEELHLDIFRLQLCGSPIKNLFVKIFNYGIEDPHAVII